MVVVVVAVVDDILVSKVILLVVIVADLAFQCSWGRRQLEVGFVWHSFGNILPKNRPTKRKTTVFLEHDEVEANAVGPRALAPPFPSTICRSLMLSSVFSSNFM